MSEVEGRSGMREVYGPVPWIALRSIRATSAKAIQKGKGEG